MSPMNQRTLRPSANLRYQARIKNLLGSSLIAHWPLWETAGSVAEDISGNGRNGTITNLSLNYRQSKQNKPSPYWSGENGKYVSLFSSGLASAFSFDEGFVIVDFYLDTSVWSSATARQLFLLQENDPFSSIDIRRLTTDNGGLRVSRYVNGGYAPYFSIGGFQDDAWYQLIFTWSVSNSIACAYVNGSLQATSVISSSYNGAPDIAILGAAGSSTGSMQGGVSDKIMGNRYLTPAEASEIYRLSIQRTSKVITTLGDSISADFKSWNQYVYKKYDNNQAVLKNHAVGGQSIMDHLDAQTLAAAGDNADVIIIEMGTNDNNAGNMAALQAEVEENIAELKISNPRAAIYYLNLLPRWTNNTGAVPVDKAAIRTAIAAACTAQGITCWDTFTTPWITAGDTTDGLHPTAAGYAAIATEVLARLP
jgi:lysophospholipase L1-like esterase